MLRDAVVAADGVDGGGGEAAAVVAGVVGAAWCRASGAMAAGGYRVGELVEGLWRRWAEVEVGWTSS